MVADDQVLAIEAAEGTDQMLARIAELRAPGRCTPVGTGVLVKAPKPEQDQRFDLPSIGPTTIQAAKPPGSRALAWWRGVSIVAEPAIACARPTGGAFRPPASMTEATRRMCEAAPRRFSSRRENPAIGSAPADRGAQGAAPGRAAIAGVGGRAMAGKG